MLVEHFYKDYVIIKENNNSKYPWSVYRNDVYVSREKSLVEAKNCIDKNVYSDRSSAITLNEYFDKYSNEYGWESTLEEDLLEEDWFNEDNNPDTRTYKVGDIVMVNDDVAGVHRILIINKINQADGELPKYNGYLLSSNMNKANKNNPKFPNNIYISDYATILKKGNPISKPAIIKVDSLIEFDHSSFSSSGTWKGHVTDEFFNFIKTCADNYRSNKSNAEMFWEK